MAIHKNDSKDLQVFSIGIQTYGDEMFQEMWYLLAQVRCQRRKEKEERRNKNGEEKKRLDITRSFDPTLKVDVEES